MSRLGAAWERSVAAALLALALAACGGNDAPLTISPETHDFGRVMLGDRRAHAFTITNHSDRTVAFKAQSNCGCFGVAQELRPLDPGKSMDVQVLFATAKLSPQQIRGKYVTIHTNHPDLPQIVMPLTGEVYRAYDLRPSLINLGRIAGTERNYEPRRVTIRPVGARNLRMTGHFSMPDVFDVESAPLQSGGLVVTLRLRKAARRPIGEFQASVRLDLEFTTSEGGVQKDQPVVEFKGFWSLGP